MDLGMSVLACLGGGHVHDLAGASLDNNMSITRSKRFI